MTDDGLQRLRSILLSRAVRFGEFTLASGKHSDLYVDLKSVFLDPEALELLGRLLFAHWHASGVAIEAVGGMTMGADPLVSAFVLRANHEGQPVPGFLIRKEPKKHGTGRRIEGQPCLPPKARALLIEDVITTAGSTLKAAAACREAGIIPVAVLAVVDREEGGRVALEEAGLPLVSLITGHELREASRPTRLP